MKTYKYFSLRGRLHEIEPVFLPRSPFVVVDFAVCVVAVAARVLLFAVGSVLLTCLFLLSVHPSKLASILRAHFEDFKASCNAEKEFTVGS